MNRLKVKRIYDEPEEGDGIRVLVDRLWPRGISKDRAHIDHWLKEIAPSSGLRKWYDHDINKWSEFRNRYFEELSAQGEQIDILSRLIEANDVTLLYSARTENHNNAVALAEFLKRRLQ